MGIRPGQATAGGEPDGILRDVARMWGAAQLWVVDAPLTDAMGAVATSLPGAVVASPLAGSPISCTDLRDRAAQVSRDGLPLVVEDAVCGPWGCPSVRLGAHLSVSRLGPWCLVGISRDATARVAESPLRDVLPVVGADALAGLGDLVEEGASRWRASSDAAQVIASYLRCHPRVREVRYPGLKADPSFGVAARTLVGGFGPIVDYALAGSAGWTRIRCRAGDALCQVGELEDALA